MSQSQSVIAKCPECNNEFIYNGKAKRPRVTCKKCKTRFYIIDQNDSKNASPNLEKGAENLSVRRRTEECREAPTFTNLDEATIEKLILDLLNEETTESRIKLAVEFHNKVKGSDALMMEEPLNMEGFLNYELSQRKEEGNTSVHKTA